MTNQLINIPEFEGPEVKNSEYTKYWDISNFKLPELDEKQFDNFFHKWIEKSNRNHNMDEYGNLIFLQGMSSEWNKRKFRLIIKEV